MIKRPLIGLFWRAYNMEKRIRNINEDALGLVKKKKDVMTVRSFSGLAIKISCGHFVDRKIASKMDTC